MKKATVLALTFLLYSCATLNEEECLTADWYQLGLSDGRLGYANRINSHRKACIKHGVRPDVSRYSSGYQKGLDSYCTYENGVRIGQAGRTHNNVCAGGARQQFYAGYLPYFRVTNTKNKINSTKRNIESYKDQLKEDDLSSDDVESVEKNLDKAINSLKNMERDLFRYEYELAVHVIDRQIHEITEYLNNPNITALERRNKLRKIDELQRLRESETQNYKLMRTARSIKEIKELFD